MEEEEEEEEEQRESGRGQEEEDEEEEEGEEDEDEEEDVMEAQENIFEEVCMDTQVCFILHVQYSHDISQVCACVHQFRSYQSASGRAVVLRAKARRKSKG